ncbi:aminotransferase class V-fold PLP-dependent enzyme [Candidatus Bathyarchaeota archaeon]|nr:aminotransferase class V-fold PLP-dependent enzyme [Candidatus Bathyarchaeota archaeon]MBS7631622.1 aminotransferase class V-fold PLP-dependent enzyme [Candidatus Bathyarchaeota archaeon]
MSIDDQIVKIRGDFPILKYKTYLNSAAHGPTLRQVWSTVQDWWRFRMNEDRGARLAEAKKQAARLIHVNGDEICWITRVSEGLNTVSSLVDLKRGDNIVVTDLAYPSNVFVWMPFRSGGIEIRRISHRDGYIEIEDFEKAIDDNTRIVCISRVEWTSGLKYNVKVVAEIAHEHNALLVDDAYQAAGVVDIDAGGEEIDFLVTGCEKWLCCPLFAGIFYVKKSLIDGFEPPYRFYESVGGAFTNGAPWEKPEHDNILDYDKPLTGTAEKFYRGNVSDEAVWGFNASLEYFNEIGVKNIERRVRRLSGYLIDGLRELHLKVNTPLEPEERAGLVTYTTGRYELDVESFRALNANGVIVALRYTGGVGGVRVSTHFFNTEDEIDKLLEIQKTKTK